MLKKVGFIGWRGMVGSVLIDRMIQEKDFDFIDPHFFSTSQVGEKGPSIKKKNPLLKDAFSLQALKEMDIIISTQGGVYTEKNFFALKKMNWDGYWIDAASTLRMKKEACLILDPVNQEIIKKRIHSGGKIFVGSNCTVGVMLMGIGGLLKENLVEWITSMSYQAISGAGAKAMKELLKQMKSFSLDKTLLDLPAQEIDKRIKEITQSENFPKKDIGYPLAGSLLPWIDREVEKGQSREEQKGFLELNKILELNPPVPIDGTCVRVGSFRSHSKALTIKLKKNIPLKDIQSIIAKSNPWVKLIDNEKAATLEKLTPYAVSSTLNIHVGRLRKMILGDTYLSAFITGDQLLWGAAEPLRRMLLILLGKL